MLGQLKNVYWIISLLGISGIIFLLYLEKKILIFLFYGLVLEI